MGPISRRNGMAARPRSDFPSHVNNQSPDVFVNSAGRELAALAIRRICEQRAVVPREDGVGPGGGRHFAHCPTAYSEANFAERRQFCM